MDDSESVPQDLFSGLIHLTSQLNTGIHLRSWTFLLSSRSSTLINLILPSEYMFGVLPNKAVNLWMTLKKQPPLLLLVAVSFLVN